MASLILLLYYFVCDLPINVFWLGALTADLPPTESAVVRLELPLWDTVSVFLFLATTSMEKDGWNYAAGKQN